MGKDFGKTFIVSKTKKVSGMAMLTILFTLFGFVVGFAVCATYAGFSSTAESNGTLSFAVNGHQGDFSFSHSKISHYNSTDLTLEFTLVGDENYDIPTLSITMGGTLLNKDGNNFKSGMIVVATYNAGVLTINRANVTASLGVTATSEISAHTVTYNASTNGGTTSATTASVNHGNSADLTQTATKTGWTFVGWNTSSTATTALSSYTVNSDITLYAIFSRVLTMNYNNNGTTGSVSTTIYNTATSGTSTTNLPAIASRSGWTISGWSSSSVANNDKVDNTTTAHAITITTSTTGGTYYATYYRTLTLSYNANGGSSTPTSQATTQFYNSAGNTSSHSFNLAGAISRTANAQYTYSFSKWAAGGTNGTQYNAGGQVTISADTTFWATWNSTVNTYNLTIYVTMHGPATYEEGDLRYSTNSGAVNWDRTGIDNNAPDFFGGRDVGCNSQVETIYLNNLAYGTVVYLFLFDDSADYYYVYSEINSASPNGATQLSRVSVYARYTVTITAHETIYMSYYFDMA